MAVHIPVHDNSVSEEFIEDPFDEELDATFPPLRYCPMVYAKPQKKVRRESSRERERLYRELVGHDPYNKTPRQTTVSNENVFWVTLDVKHYRPEEITLKVDGQLLVVSGKHYNQTEAGYESSEFQRKYNIPDSIDTHTLTSNITQDGVLCIKAVNQLSHTDDEDKEQKENFQVTLDVAGYQPDEITIKVHDRNLIIHGESKQEKDSHHGQTSHHQQFTRHFTLPSDVDIDVLSSRYTKDCKITVEAPRGSVSPQTRTLQIKKED